MNEAELLFSDMLKCDRASLYLNSKRRLTNSQCAFIAAALKRRLRAEPLQYILGWTEFMGLEFRVTPDVFIPRPETELLVEEAVRIAKVKSSRLTILDVGTGSGCIAVSLAKVLPGALIDAMDISGKALVVAQENARLHKVAINFIHASLGAKNAVSRKYDIILSNPPYIPSDEIAHLQGEVRHEPRRALDGGGDGLSFYRALIARAHTLLKADGVLAMELGFGQRKAVERLLNDSKKFEITGVIKDYNNIERVMVTRYG